MRTLILISLCVVFAFADTQSDIRDLQIEKEKLNSEIQKLNKQILATDSMLRQDANRYKTLQDRFKMDTERRKSEIDSLNVKIKNVANQLSSEREKQAHAKNRSENVKSKRKALKNSLNLLCKEFELQIEKTIPWEKESRLDRIKSLTRDIESGNTTEEEIFSRLKSLINEEIKFGDEVTIVNSPITRNNGELVNAQILRIGNQWMVYIDENETLFGSLVRKIDKDNKTIKFEWNENLDLTEREAIKFAIDVKKAKKPPQIISLPVSLSIFGEEK